MDSPINPNSQDDLEDIEKDISKDDNKRKFYIVFTALMIALCIIVIGVVIIVLTRNNNQNKSNEPKWEELPNNEVYENFECQANENSINAKFMGNLWNTPPRNSTRWKEGFQDMNMLVGYPQLKYNEGKTECKVTVFTKTAIELDLTYIFDGVEQKENFKVFSNSFKKVLKIHTIFNLINFH